MKSKVKNLWHKIRIWNVWWNPFFSPSLYWEDIWKTEFMIGLDSTLSPPPTEQTEEQDKESIHKVDT